MTIDRAELQRLEAAATDGEWRSSPHVEMCDPGWLVYLAPGDGGPFGSQGDVGWSVSRADADFIVAARNALPSLLAELAEKDAEIEEMQGELRGITDALRQYQALVAELEAQVRNHRAGPPVYDGPDWASVYDLGDTLARHGFEVSS